MSSADPKLLAAVEGYTRQERNFQDAIAKEQRLYQQELREREHKHVTKIRQWTENLKQATASKHALLQQIGQKAPGQMPNNVLGDQVSAQQAEVNGNHVTDNTDANGNDHYASTSDDEGPPGFASAKSSSGWSQAYLQMDDSASSAESEFSLHDYSSTQQQNQVNLVPYSDYNPPTFSKDASNPTTAIRPCKPLSPRLLNVLLPSESTGRMKPFRFDSHPCRHSPATPTHTSNRLPQEPNPVVAQQLTLTGKYPPSLLNQPNPCNGVRLPRFRSAEPFLDADTIKSVSTAFNSPPVLGAPRLASSHGTVRFSDHSICQRKLAKLSPAAPLRFGGISLSLNSARRNRDSLQAQNGSTPLSTGNSAQSRSVFSRLDHSTPTQQTPQLRSSAPASSHDHPPGFATPQPSASRPPSDAQDLPPGFANAASLSAQPAQRSGMRSDQPQYSAPRSASRQPASSSISHHATPEGPPGFAGVPSFLAQRLSPGPAQQPSAAPNQARPSPNASTPAQRSRTPSSQAQHPQPSARDSSSLAQSQSSYSGSQHPSTGPADFPPGYPMPPSSAPPGFIGPPERPASPADAPQGKRRQNAGPAADQAETSTSHNGRANSNAAMQGGDEFPGLSFGIKGLDQQQRWSSVDDVQDFPSLGAPAGGTAGPKPAGAWGKGAGQLAGSLRQQQQVSNVASSLAASVQPPQPATVHIERVELNAGLRVAGDDASDGIRKKRAKKHEFEKWERLKGRGDVNIVQGLELHDNVLSPDEQANMVNIIEDWVVQGKQGKLRGRTFSAPRKWARGKGRITCQFGCCYNYAIDSEGRNPGIVAEEVVEKMPPILVSLCKRLVRWGILPKQKEPDTAIVNVYDVDDCIPPHIDHHDFDRPFCTISLLSQQNIMFGSKIISRGPGDFLCDFEIPLPVGSCLVLKGNGADVAQHCVPPVSARRISITLRRMQDVHARRVVAMAERVHAGLPVDTDNPPQRLSADDAYDMDERKGSSYGSRRR